MVNNDTGEGAKRRILTVRLTELNCFRSVRVRCALKESNFPQTKLGFDFNNELIKYSKQLKRRTDIYKYMYIDWNKII